LNPHTRRLRASRSSFGLRAHLVLSARFELAFLSELDSKSSVYSVPPREHVARSCHPTYAVGVVREHGTGRGNRTLDFCLEGRGITTMQHRHIQLDGSQRWSFVSIGRWRRVPTLAIPMEPMAGIEPAYNSLGNCRVIRYATSACCPWPDSHQTGG
jgi:hypothetical protein